MKANDRLPVFAEENTTILIGYSICRHTQKHKQNKYNSNANSNLQGT